MIQVAGVRVVAILLTVTLWLASQLYSNAALIELNSCM